MRNPNNYLLEVQQQLYPSANQIQAIKNYLQSLHHSCGKTDWNLPYQQVIFSLLFEKLNTDYQQLNTYLHPTKEKFITTIASINPYYRFVSAITLTLEEIADLEKNEDSPVYKKLWYEVHHLHCLLSQLPQVEEKKNTEPHRKKQKRDFESDRELLGYVTTVFKLTHEYKTNFLTTNARIQEFQYLMYYMPDLQVSSEFNEKLAAEIIHFSFPYYKKLISLHMDPLTIDHGKWILFLRKCALLVIENEAKAPLTKLFDFITFQCTREHRGLITHDLTEISSPAAYHELYGILKSVFDQSIQPSTCMMIPILLATVKLEVEKMNVTQYCKQIIAIAEKEETYFFSERLYPLLQPIVLTLFLSVAVNKRLSFTKFSNYLPILRTFLKKNKAEPRVYQSNWGLYFYQLFAENHIPLHEFIDLTTDSGYRRNFHAQRPSEQLILLDIPGQMRNFDCSNSLSYHALTNILQTNPEIKRLTVVSCVAKYFILNFLFPVIQNNYLTALDLILHNAWQRTDINLFLSKFAVLNQNRPADLKIRFLRLTESFFWNLALEEYDQVIQSLQKVGVVQLELHFAISPESPRFLTNLAHACQVHQITLAAVILEINSPPSTPELLLQIIQTCANYSVSMLDITDDVTEIIAESNLNRLDELFRLSKFQRVRYYHTISFRPEFAGNFRNTAIIFAQLITAIHKSGIPEFEFGSDYEMCIPMTQQENLSVLLGDTTLKMLTLDIFRENTDALLPILARILTNSIMRCQLVLNNNPLNFTKLFQAIQRMKHVELDLSDNYLGDLSPAEFSNFLTTLLNHRLRLKMQPDEKEYFCLEKVMLHRNYILSQDHCIREQYKQQLIQLTTAMKLVADGEFNLLIHEAKCIGRNLVVLCIRHCHPRISNDLIYYIFDFLYEDNVTTPRSRHEYSQRRSILFNHNNHPKHTEQRALGAAPKQ